MHNWHRRELKSTVTELLTKWEPRIGVNVVQWGIKEMVTRWGTCNADACRIWLNRDLARLPVECIEYVVVHELVHILDHTHGERFQRLMDIHLPEWRRLRSLLNDYPLLSTNCDTHSRKWAGEGKTS